MYDTPFEPKFNSENFDISYVYIAKKKSIFGRKKPFVYHCAMRKISQSKITV